jgi:two-component system LytT family response regulator
MKKYTCIIVDDEPIAREILETHLQKIDAITVVKSCKNAIEAFNVLHEKSVDLIFLDINMPEISGLSFAKSINKSVKVIFTTAYREYAVEGFDLQAVDYLLKPISFERLFKAVQKFIEEQPKTVVTNAPLSAEEKSDFIFVRSDRKMIKIDLPEILYIESLGDYLKFYLHSGTVVSRETMSNIISKLPTDAFLRVHRSFIVALSKISSYTNEHIEIHQKAIPISRSYKNDVLNKLENI